MKPLSTHYQKNTFSPLLRSLEPLDDRAFHLFLELSCDLRIIHIIHSPCYTTSCLSFVDVVWKPFLVCRRWSWTSSGLVPRNVDVRREETLCLKPRMHETPQIMGRKHGNMFFCWKGVLTLQPFFGMLRFGIRIYNWFTVIWSLYKGCRCRYGILTEPFPRHVASFQPTNEKFGAARMQ